MTTTFCKVVKHPHQVRSLQVGSICRLLCQYWTRKTSVANSSKGWRSVARNVRDILWFFKKKKKKKVALGFSIKCRVNGTLLHSRDPHSWGVVYAQAYSWSFRCHPPRNPQCFGAISMCDKSFLKLCERYEYLVRCKGAVLFSQNKQQWLPQYWRRPQNAKGWLNACYVDGWDKIFREVSSMNDEITQTLCNRCLDIANAVVVVIEPGCRLSFLVEAVAVDLKELLSASAFNCVLWKVSLHSKNKDECFLSTDSHNFSWCDCVNHFSLGFLKFSAVRIDLYISRKWEYFLFVYFPNNKRDCDKSSFVSFSFFLSENVCFETNMFVERVHFLFNKWNLLWIFVSQTQTQLQVSFFKHSGDFCSNYVK